MKKDQQGLFHSTKTEQQFIFYKTEEVSSSEKTDTGSKNIAKALQMLFPVCSSDISFQIRFTIM